MVRGLPVDGSGQLPFGAAFDDEHGLKQVLLARKERFVEALVEKLLAYGTGRSMTFRDQPEIRKIAAASERQGYGLRELIKAVVASDAFGKR